MMTFLSLTDDVPCLDARLRMTGTGRSVAIGPTLQKHIAGSLLSATKLASRVRAEPSAPAAVLGPLKPGAKSALIHTTQPLEDAMDEQWRSFTSMFAKLAEDLKLPRVDTEKLIETHRKNIDALARSAEAASEGARGLAVKQREIVEEAIRETSAMVREFELESPQDAIAKQSELARRAFEAAIRNTGDVAQLVQKSSTDALRIIQERMQQSFEKIRGSVEEK
jgi:phasin family protein